MEKQHLIRLAVAAPGDFPKLLFATKGRWYCGMPVTADDIFRPHTLMQYCGDNLFVDANDTQCHPENYAYLQEQACPVSPP
jgi:hypothetical protein